MPAISRRSLVLGGASAASLAVLCPRFAAADGEITVEQFRALSARLTGADLGDLPVEASRKLLDGFISMGHGPELARLAADPAVSTGALADAIVGAWYSGTFGTSAGLATIGLTNALLWDALDFTKPRGICGGATGYWAAAPRA